MRTLRNSARKILLILALAAPLAAWAEIRWRTTHGVLEQGACKLLASTVRVKVTPAYLDVEEEAEVAAVGGVLGGGDANSLEIFGDFDMVPGSTLVGMLLWNGDILLKARLKGTALAREDYEKVVDRDKAPPVRPRDPALIEALGNDRYRLAIYPVASGKFRRIRIRYHIPVQMAPSGAMLRLRTVFPVQVPDNPGRITVKWERAGGEDGILLHVDGKAQALPLPTTTLLASTGDVFLTEAQPPKALAAMTSFSEGNYKGQYASLYFLTPDKIANYPVLATGPKDFSVAAVVRSGAERYALDLNCSWVGGLRCDPLEFHGKAAAGWSPEVEWKLYNAAGRELTSVTVAPKEFIRPEDSCQVALWAGSSLPFAEVRERWLGFKYGFVDMTASLLALEQDLLPASLVPVYANSGVPRLTQADILAPDTNDVFVPVPVPGNPGNIGNPVPTAVRKLERSGSGPVARLVSRGMPLLSLDLARIAAPRDGSVRVTLYGLDGAEAFTAEARVSSDGGPALLRLPAGLKSGFYFLKVEGRGFRWSEKILLRM